MRGKLNSTKFFKDQLKSFKKLETNKETNKVEKKICAPHLLAYKLAFGL